MTQPFILDTTGLFNGLATKIAPLKVKPVSAIIVDPIALKHLLVNTLEANVDPAHDAFFCIGVEGEAWVQTTARVLERYNLESVDSTGWMTMVPKPDAFVQVFMVSWDHYPEGRAFPKSGDHGYIVGKWGESLQGGSIKNAQAFTAGDAICRDPLDPANQWVVRRHIWNKSYKVLP